MLPFLQNIYAPKHVETKPPETETTPKPVKIKKIVKRVKIPINKPEEDLDKAENLKKLEIEQSQLQLRNAISNAINKIGRKKREISDFDPISDSNTSEENLDFETTNVVEEGTVDHSENINQDQSYLESAADPVIDNPEIESPIENNSDLVYPELTNPEPVNPEPVNPESYRSEPGNQDPANLEPVYPELTNPEPVNPEPVNPEPHNPEPVNQELVNPQPDDLEHVDEEPVNPDPVNPEPVNPEPVNTELVTPETVNPESLIPESVDFQLAAPETISPINSDSETSLPNPEEPSSQSNQVMVNPIQDENIEDASLLPGRL
jgi:hypothetical protein